MISFERVSKRYPNGREALTDLSFAIHDGEMAFLTGRSGAGKSTVLKLIALLERPTRGQVLVNGDNTAKLPLRRVPLFRRGLGVVFQDHRLLMDRPVFDNVALPLIVADTSFRRNRQAGTPRRARPGGPASRQGARRATGAVGGRTAARGYRARHRQQAAAAGGR